MSLSKLCTNTTVVLILHKKEDAIAAAQSEVTKVYEWSQTWKLNLNADKSKCCSFSILYNDSKWCPSLTIGGNKLELMTPLSYLALCLTAAFSSMLTLNITQSLSSRLWAITVTVYASWDWQKLLLSTAFNALVCSKLDYATPTWQPGLSNINITSLDHLQNQALCLITGQLVSTLLECLRLESGIQSY